MCCVYVDSIDTGGKSRKSNKTVYAFYWTPVGNTSLEARRVITVVLRWRCCQTCGCGGRCTINAIWHRTCWSWAALKRGFHPVAGPCGEVLTGIWAAVASTKLAQSGQVTQVGADWEAIADCLGTRRWNHKACPCPWCACSARTMHDYRAQHHPLTSVDWAAELAAARVVVRLDVAGADAMEAALQPDLRDGGSRGRALVHGVPGSPL